MMNLQSDDIGKIAAALVKTQASIRGAAKTSENPFFKSRYADLGEVWNACREQLQAHKIAVVQGAQPVDGKHYMETKLIHESGQWISSLWELTPVKQDPQAVGSAITYMRRYSLAAMVGVVTEDDDGEGAMSREKKRQSERKPPKQSKANGKDPNGEATTPEFDKQGALIVHTTAKGDGSDWVRWGKEFKAVGNEKKNAKDFAELVDKNTTPLAGLEEYNKAWSGALWEYIEERRATLHPLSAG